jgi:hypothetical protein
MCFIIWICFIVLCKIDSCPTYCYSFLKVLNQNLNLKFHQMDFWFVFLDIHVNGKVIICHDCNGFKWQNINIFQILTIFLLSNSLFGSLDCDYTHLSKFCACDFFLVFKFIIIFILVIFFIVVVNFMFQNDVSKWDVNVSKHLKFLKNT